MQAEARAYLNQNALYRHSNHGDGYSAITHQRACQSKQKAGEKRATPTPHLTVNPCDATAQHDNLTKANLTPRANGTLQLSFQAAD